LLFEAVSLFESRPTSRPDFEAESKARLLMLVDSDRE